MKKISYIVNYLTHLDDFIHFPVSTRYSTENDQVTLGFYRPTHSTGKHLSVILWTQNSALNPSACE
jgi:hypothetical protein